MDGGVDEDRRFVLVSRGWYHCTTATAGTLWETRQTIPCRPNHYREYPQRISIHLTIAHGSLRIDVLSG